MRRKLSGMKGLVVGIALIAGITVGTLSSKIVLVQADNYLNKDMKPAHVFPKNEQGQTYGFDIDASSPENRPDLIAAEAVDGTRGYVKRTDVEGPLPKTPEEAVAITKKNMAKGEKKIPLYAEDGTTIVGWFTVGKGEYTEK